MRNVGLLLIDRCHSMTGLDFFCFLFSEKEDFLLPPIFYSNRFILLFLATRILRSGKIARVVDLISWVGWIISI